MKLAHLADLHLGFRQFTASQAGRNVRELDVALALRRVVDDLLTQRPDVVAIAGDVFHAVRPTNGAILTLFQQLQRLRCGLPDCRILLVAGNHDTPRTAESSCILPLYQTLNVDLALLEPIQVRVGDVVLTGVPSAAATRIPEPDATAALNVLVLHAPVAGLCGPAPADAADPDALERAGWDYVALGDFHVCAQVGPRAWYSGAIEYTSTDPWGELMKQNELQVPGKGYLLVELPGGTPQFRPIGPTRRFVDVPPIEGTGKNAAELDAELASRVAETEIDGAVVRLVVREVKREVKAALNHAQIRAWKARALHFQLELRRAADERSTPASRAALHRRLDEAVEVFLRGRELPPGVEREGLVHLGLEYLKSVDDPYTGVVSDPEPAVSAATNRGVGPDGQPALEGSGSQAVERSEVPGEF